MNTIFRVAAVAAVLAASAAPAFAQPKAKPIPEPLPMGVPYIYQPGNNYWYAPALPVYRSHRGAMVAGYPYPFASSGPMYGRYSWDYTGAYSAGYGSYSTNLPHYPYSYQYPTITGRVWMGYGW